MAEEEGGLGGADVVAGAVVIIDGDITGLEQAEREARTVAERIDALTATVRIGADESELIRIVGSAERLTGGGKGLVLAPRIDEAAVLRQSQALLDKVRDQWSAGLVITPRFASPAGGLPVVSGGGTFTSTIAAGGAPLPSGGYGPGGVAISTPNAGPAPGRPSLPYYPAAPRTHVPAEFTRRGIEQTLVSAYQSQGGGFTVDDEEKLRGAAGAGDPWMFHKELPAEVKHFLERDDLAPKARRKLRNLFRVTQEAGRGGGADAMGELGEDEYFRIGELVAGSDVGPALAHARQSDDPEQQYLANLHANLPRSTTAGQARRLRRKADAASDPARRRQLLERADRLHQRAADEAEELESLPAAKLEQGHTFTAHGREHRVERNEDDELRLTNDDGLDVPVAGLRHVLSDAGTLRRSARPDGDGGDDDVPDWGLDDAGSGGGPPATASAAPGGGGRGNGPIKDYGRQYGPRLANGDFLSGRSERDRLASLVMHPGVDYGPALPDGSFTQADAERVGRMAAGGYGGEHGPRLANGDFRAGRTERENYDVNRRRDRAVAAGAEPGRFDQQVEEKVSQGSGRAQAAREVEAEYRRAAAAAKREADADEKAAAAAERRASAAQDRADRHVAGTPRQDRIHTQERERFHAHGRDEFDRRVQERIETEGAVPDRAAREVGREMRDQIAAASDVGPEYGPRLADGTFRSPGGRAGGLSGGTNLFSMRGIGRLIGTATGGLAAIQAIDAVGSLAAANRQADEVPAQAIEDMTQPGQLHSPGDDPTLRGLADQMGQVQASRTRSSIVTSFPLVGSFVDNLTGISAGLNRRERGVTRSVEFHNATVAEGDEQKRVAAAQSYRAGDPLRLQADEDETKAENTLKATMHGGVFDTAAYNTAIVAQDQAAVQRAQADRLDDAQKAERTSTVEAAADVGQSITARLGGRPLEAEQDEHAATLASARGQFQAREAPILNEQKRKEAETDDATALTNMQRQFTVEEAQTQREQDATKVGVRAEAASAVTAGDAARAEGSHDSRAALEATLAGRKASATSQALQQIIGAGGNADLQTLAITAAQKQLGTYTPNAADPTKATFAGGGSVDDEAAAARKLLADNEQSEKTRLEAEGAANRLRIVHDSAGATITALEGVKKAAEQTGDVATRVARVAEAQSQIDFAKQQQTEHRQDESEGADATVKSSELRMNRQEFDAHKVEFDAETNRQLRHADAADRDDISRSRDAQWQATAAQHDFALRVGREDLGPERDAADQDTAGQGDRAAATRRERSIVHQSETATPELKAEAAATARAELREMRSQLTGHHGGAVVHGQDRGSAGAELLAGRIHGQQDKQIEADIDKAAAQVDANANAPAKRLAPRRPAAVTNVAPRIGAGPNGAAPPITGGPQAKIIAEHPAVYGGGQPTAHSAAPGGGGGNELSAVIQKLDAIGKMVGDFLGRTSHSPAVLRG